jgi:hypothetical protein
VFVAFFCYAVIYVNGAGFQGEIWIVDGGTGTKIGWIDDRAVWLSTQGPTDLLPLGKLGLAFLETRLLIIQGNLPACPSLTSRWKVFTFAQREVIAITDAKIAGC